VVEVGSRRTTTTSSGMSASGFAASSYSSCSSTGSSTRGQACLRGPGPWDTPGGKPAAGLAARGQGRSPVRAAV